MNNMRAFLERTCNAEYRKGREKNIFLRQFDTENGETLFELFKNTKGCSYTIKLGNFEEMDRFINDNGYTVVKIFQ